MDLKTLFGRDSKKYLQLPVNTVQPTQRKLSCQICYHHYDIKTKMLLEMRENVLVLVLTRTMLKNQCKRFSVLLL